MAERLRKSASGDGHHNDNGDRGSNGHGTSNDGRPIRPPRSKLMMVT